MNDIIDFKAPWFILEEFYPATILFNSEFSIIKSTKSLSDHLPSIKEGTKITDTFTREDSFAASTLTDLADTATQVDLVSREKPIKIRGVVLKTGDRYLLLARYLPTPFDLGGELRMSDFAPNDPVVSAMMLLGVQKAMLEESKQAALELAHARQQTAELLQRFSRVAGFMAHDFNNLLSIIRLNAERLLNGEKLSDRNRRLSSIIYETTVRGSEISRSLMTLSSQRNDSSLPLNIDGFIHENSSFLRSIAGGGVYVSFSLNARDSVIQTSRSGILNCIVNLIINARDAMPDGGKIRITTRLDNASPKSGSARMGSCVVLEVLDTGEGMEPEIASRAFEPLFSTKANGNGIGLASVLDFAEEMGGHVLINSEPGEGTCIVMYLPLDAGNRQPEDADGIASPSGDRSPAAPCFAGMSVLLVEDEPYALEALGEILEGWGMRVRLCAGYQEASTALTESDGQDFQFLISDIVMSDGNGIDLAEFACVSSPGLQVILMSGFVPSAGKMRATWQYLRKPLDSSVLREMVEAAFAKRQSSNV